MAIKQVIQDLEYTTPGVYSFVTTYRIRHLALVLMGAGGGGGSGGTDVRGLGGGAGELISTTIYDIPIGTQITVHVGAGGAGGVKNATIVNPDGSAGGISSVTLGGVQHTAAGGAPNSFDGYVTGMYYRTSDWGDFAYTYSGSTGEAANNQASQGGKGGGQDSLNYANGGDYLALLSGKPGTNGGGGGGAAPSRSWVHNRGFYQDPINGSGGPGFPHIPGGDGGNGYALLSITGHDGTPMSFTDINNEFKNPSSPLSLSSYYRGGLLVPNAFKNNKVSTTGAISYSMFYGAADIFRFPNTNGVWSINYDFAFDNTPYQYAQPLRLNLSRTGTGAVTYKMTVYNTYGASVPTFQATANLNTAVIDHGDTVEYFDVSMFWRKGCNDGNDNNIYMTVRISMTNNNGITATLLSSSTDSQWGC